MSFTLRFERRLPILESAEFAWVVRIMSWKRLAGLEAMNAEKNLAADICMLETVKQYLVKFLTNLKI